MRKFFISGGILLVLILFIISLYIPPTYNKKSLSLIERLKCVFTPESIKAKAIESYVQKISENTYDSPEDNLSRLDKDARLFALTNWAQKVGHSLEIDEETGQINLTFTEKSCTAKTNLETITDPNTGENIYDIKSPYFEWHNGSCVKTFPLVKSTCNNQFGLDYYQGDVSCDEGGKCTVNKNPTCYLSSDYCFSMGLEYEGGDGGLGNCYNSLLQDILENIFGTTITRQYKKAIYNMISNCRNNPLSSDCGKSIWNYQITGPLIVKDTLVAFYPERWNNLLNTCGAVDGSSRSIINCLLAYATFDPVFYLAVQIVKVLEKLICDMLVNATNDPLISLSCDLGGKAIQGILNGIDKGVEIMIKYGPIIGKAIAEAITLLVENLQDLANTVKEEMLKMFDDIDNFVNSIPGFIDNIIFNFDYHPVLLCANSILYGSLDVVNLYVDFYKDGKIKDIIQYSAVISSAFEEGQELGKFVTSRLILDGISSLNDTGQVMVTAFGDSSTFFLNTTQDISNVFKNQIGGELKNVGENIGEGAVDLGENIADGLNDGWKATGGAFEDVGDFVSGGCVLM